MIDANGGLMAKLLFLHGCNFEQSLNEAASEQGLPVVSNAHVINAVVMCQDCLWRALASCNVIIDNLDWFTKWVF